MKTYMKGVITGVLLGTAISSIPAIAESIDVLFNTVRVSINGVDQIQWGEEITLSDGSTAPSSILYNGTTYLPLRKIGEITENKVYWNGDSKTISITNIPQNVKTLAVKPDSNGNVWEYYTFEDNSGNNYLGVRDNKREYNRTYLMACNSVRITENEIYFIRLNKINAYFLDNNAYIVKLPFNNDKNSQDGETIKLLSQIYTNELIFDDDWLFYINSAGGTSMHSEINALNYLTNTEVAYRDASGTKFSNIMLVKNSENNSQIRFNVTTASNSSRTDEITFDKINLSFEESKTITPEKQ